MTEKTGDTIATEESNAQGTEAKEFQAITSQEDFDKAIQARIARERAKLPTDYDDLRAKAAKLAEIEESNKTEAQKAQDRLEAAERRADELELKAIRAEVAASKGVPVGLLTGATQAELEASADALITFRGQQADLRLHVPSEGSTAKGASSTADQFVAFAESKF